MFQVSPFCNSKVEYLPALQAWIDSNHEQISGALDELKKSKEISDGILLAGAPAGYRLAKVFLFNAGSHPAEIHHCSTQATRLFSGRLRFELEERMRKGIVTSSKSIQSFYDDPDGFVLINKGVAHQPVVIEGPVLGIVFHTDPKVADQSCFGKDFDELFGDK